MSQSSESPELKDVIDVMAQAVFRETVRQLVEKIKNKSYDLEHISAVFVEASRESDRSAAILVFALIDDVMLHFFRQEMNPDIRGGLNSLFGVLRPLATAGAREQVAAALYWITTDVYDDLHRLRTIRNQFAHNAKIHDFEHNLISTQIKALGPREVYLFHKPELAKYFDFLKNAALRQLFFVRSVLTVQALIFDLIIAPSAQRMNLPRNPFESFDDLPENLKEVRRTAAKTICLVLGFEIGEPARS